MKIDDPTLIFLCDLLKWKKSFQVKSLLPCLEVVVIVLSDRMIEDEDRLRDTKVYWFREAKERLIKTGLVKTDSIVMGERWILLLLNAISCSFQHQHQGSTRRLFFKFYFLRKIIERIVQRLTERERIRRI